MLIRLAILYHGLKIKMNDNAKELKKRTFDCPLFGDCLLTADY